MHRRDDMLVKNSSPSANSSLRPAAGADSSLRPAAVPSSEEELVWQQTVSANLGVDIDLSLIQIPRVGVRPPGYETVTIKRP